MPGMRPAVHARDGEAGLLEGEQDLGDGLALKLAGPRSADVFRGDTADYHIMPVIWADKIVEGLSGRMEEIAAEMLDKSQACLAKGRTAMVAAHLATKGVVVYSHRQEVSQLVLNEHDAGAQHYAVLQAVLGRPLVRWHLGCKNPRGRLPRLAGDTQEDVHRIIAMEAYMQEAPDPSVSARVACCSAYRPLRFGRCDLACALLRSAPDGACGMRARARLCWVPDSADDSCTTIFPVGPMRWGHLLCRFGRAMATLVRVRRMGDRKASGRQ